MFALRWGIAIVGVWWVVSNMSLRDKVWVLDEANIPHVATLAEPAGEDEDFFTIWDPQTGQKRNLNLAPWSPVRTYSVAVPWTV